jgi:hypothetical protein
MPPPGPGQCARSEIAALALTVMEGKVIVGAMSDDADS